MKKFEHLKGTVPYKGNLKWLEGNTLFLTVHGSHAYGVATEKSDLDLKGVTIPPKEYFFGFMDNFNQVDTQTPYDMCIYDLRNFIKLALSANPNIIEMLFTSEKFHLKKHPSFKIFLDNKDLFLSKKAKHTFMGFATSQISKIRTQRKWLSNPVTNKPVREDFGLPPDFKSSKVFDLISNVILDPQINSWAYVFESVSPEDKEAVQRVVSELIGLNNAKWTTIEDSFFSMALKKKGIPKELEAWISKEREYSKALKDYKTYSNWVKSVDVDAFDKTLGYDPKGAYHVVRLVRMATELLTTGELLVERPDASELLEIRGGSWSYQKLIDWFGQKESEIKQLVLRSSLPKSPDSKKVNSILIDVVEVHLKKSK